MSFKVSAFKALVPAPKTAEKFVVVIPGLTTTSSLYGTARDLLDPANAVGEAARAQAESKFKTKTDSVFLCSKANFPTESWGSDKIWSNGYYVELPTRRNHPSDFTCTVSENMLCEMLPVIDHMLTLSTLDAKATAKLGMEQLDFSKSEGEVPKLRLFTIEVYLLDQIIGSLPTVKRTLTGCWLKSVAPVDLNWQSATTPIDWQLTFSVQEIKPNSIEDAMRVIELSNIVVMLQRVLAHANTENLLKTEESNWRMQLQNILSQFGMSIPVL